MRFVKLLTLLFTATILFGGCASVVLEPADFAWPIESVLTIDENGMIQDNRYSFSVNVKPLFFAEKQDTLNLQMESVRIIRGTKGYYYLIAPTFKNVYVFNADDGRMILVNQISVSETGLELPAFNQRPPYIELLDGGKHLFFINNYGIKESESEK